jgi:hypothetical protein
MSVQTLIQNYGHHHPDHLEAARKAFAHRSPGPIRDRMTRPEREQTALNETEMADRAKAAEA